jgi:hypothetical protein
VSPVLFEPARDGDEVPGEAVLRLAAEVSAFAPAAIGRLGPGRDDLDVVPGGGLLRAGLPLLDDAVRAGIQRRTPGAEVLVIDCEPITGAGLLALSEAQAPPGGGRTASGSAATGAGPVVGPAGDPLAPPARSGSAAPLSVVHGELCERIHERPAFRTPQVGRKSKSGEFEILRRWVPR